jgi:hypothetical protein
MLKRYIVFACDEYEPQGGWEDVVRDGLDENGNPIARSFDSLDAAREAAVASLEPITQIVDLLIGRVVR